MDKKFTRIFSFILAFMMLFQFSMPAITSFAYDEKEQGLAENNVDVKKENEKISKDSNKAPPKMVEPLKLDEKNLESSFSGEDEVVPEISEMKDVSRVMSEKPQVVEADGSKIETISVDWVTSDAVADNKDEELNVKWHDDRLQGVQARINYALSGGYDYPAGSIQISVPKKIFKDRDGNLIGTTKLAVLEAPDKSGDFAYVEKEDSYIFINTKKLSAATQGYIGNNVSQSSIDKMVNDGSLKRSIIIRGIYQALNNVSTMFTKNDLVNSMKNVLKSSRTALMGLVKPTTSYAAAPKVVHSGTMGTTTWEIFDNRELVLRPTSGSVGEFTVNDYGGIYAPWHDYEGTFDKIRVEGIVRPKGSLYRNKDYGGLFTESKAKEIDLQGFDTSNVTSMYYLFSHPQTTIINLGDRFDTNNVVDTSGMFPVSLSVNLKNSFSIVFSFVCFNVVFDLFFCLLFYHPPEAPPPDENPPPKPPKSKSSELL